MACRVNINQMSFVLPGTSDGTESHINDTSGGHCSDTKRGIFMKIEVYVCKKNNLNVTGIFISLPRSCLRPLPFHSLQLLVFFRILHFGYVSRTFCARAERII